VLLTLRVRDLARSLDFFHERLGIPIKLRAGSLVELQTETVLLTLMIGEPDPGSSSLAWEVRDLEDARRDLAARGIECEDVALPSGVDAAVFGRRLSFQDPDGHRFELACWVP